MKKIFFLIVLVAFPLSSYALGPLTCSNIYGLGITNLQSAVVSFGCLIKDAGKLLVPLAVLFFLYGLMKFILNAGSEEAQKSGKNIMIWGIITLFIMVSFWGIITLIQSNLSITNVNFP